MTQIRLSQWDDLPKYMDGVYLITEAVVAMKF
jgi:hypothetical protein